MTRPAALPLPPWLAHALRAQRGPVPWNAVLRGALAGGPLLLVAVLLGRPSVGVLAALGAMLAGINDRPGSRRAAVQRLGVPALAGAVGLLAGTYAYQYAGAVVLTLLLTALGLLARRYERGRSRGVRSGHATAGRGRHRGRDAVAGTGMGAGARLPHAAPDGCSHCASPCPHPRSSPQVTTASTGNGTPSPPSTTRSPGCWTPSAPRTRPPGGPH